MSTLTADLLVRLDWLFQDAEEISIPSENGILEFSRHLAAGSSNFQLEKRWRSQRTLAAGANESIDLRSLALTQGGLTGTISFSTVRLIVVRMLTDVAGLRLGGTNGANEWFAPFQASGGRVEVGAGSIGVLSDLYDGWAVSAGAKDFLLTNLSGAQPADFQIAIVGN